MTARNLENKFETQVQNPQFSNPEFAKSGPKGDLQIAVKENNLKELARLLLENPEDINIENERGFKAIHFVQSPQAAQMLIKTGAKVNARNIFENTPLHTVVSSGQTSEVVQVLLNAGAEVNAADSNGYRPLHFVHSPEVAQLLIDNGAEVNAVGRHGDTPLHNVVFIKQSTEEVAIVLLCAGAEVNAEDWLGRVALHSVCIVKLAEILIAFGADVTLLNQEIKPLSCMTEEDLAQAVADARARFSSSEGRPLSREQLCKILTADGSVSDQASLILGESQLQVESSE
jgi:ankyrin repeat protein